VFYEGLRLGSARVKRSPPTKKKSGFTDRPALTDHFQHNLLMLCPRCGLKDAEPSRFRWYDTLFYLIGRRPLQCLGCYSRFHRRPLRS
jgi:hypothetical protein